MASTQLTTTKLLKRYFQKGLLDHARQLFDKTPHKDIFLWTSMISGFTSNGCHLDSWNVFRGMLEAGILPNEFTVSSVLVACRELRWRVGGSVVHGVAIKRGLVGFSYVDNMLLDLYASCGGGGIDDALVVFEGIEAKTEVSWTMMIAAYTRFGDWDLVFGLFRRMIQEGVGLNPFSCSITIRACSSTKSFNFGRQLHAYAVKSMFEANLPVSNSLLDFYCRCMSLPEAKQYFSEMLQRDLISWNTIIGGLVRCSPCDAFSLLHDVESHGLQPNCITFCSAIAACVELAVLHCGQQVHGTIIRRGFHGNLPIANALIDMYAKCGCVSDSRMVFNDMEQKDLLSWTSMMNAYGAHGHAKEAIKLFEEMVALCIPLDHIVFVGVISACSHAGLVDEGLAYFNQMITHYGVSPSIQIYGCVVDLLGRAGRVEEAYDLIVKMPFKPDESVWGALLGACKIHKNVGLGKLASKKILDLKPYGATTYVMLSNIYAADGEWNEFARVRKMMKSTGHRKEVGKSWIEIKDSVYSFAVGDRCNPEVNLVYDVLDVLIQHMNDAGYEPEFGLEKCS